MDDGLRLKRLEGLQDEFIVPQVPHEELDLLPRHFVPRLHTIVQRADGHQGFDVQFHFPATLGEIVNHPHHVTVG